MHCSTGGPTSQLVFRMTSSASTCCPTTAKTTKAAAETPVDGGPIVEAARFAAYLSLAAEGAKDEISEAPPRSGPQKDFFSLVLLEKMAECHREMFGELPKFDHGNQLKMGISILSVPGRIGWRRF